MLALGRAGRKRERRSAEIIIYLFQKSIDILIFAIKIKPHLYLMSSTKLFSKE
jgi:predicted HTH domain antitoxin